MKTNEPGPGAEPKWRFTDEALPEVPPPPRVESPLSNEEAALNTSWMRLQIIHTAFRAADQAQYLALTEALKSLELMFLERDEDLGEYYKECFAPETEIRPMPGPALTGPDYADIDHIAAIQMQLMEDVYYVLRLDRYGNATDNRGWMNLFRRWGRSATFNHRFDRSRALFDLDFLEFYDLYLRYYYCRIDEYPIPHPWDSEAWRRSTNRRYPLDPPLRTGGEPGASCPPIIPLAAKTARTPRDWHLLPGLFLDPGIREVPGGEGPQPAPVTSPAAGKEQSLGGGGGSSGSAPPAGAGGGTSGSESG